MSLERFHQAQAATHGGYAIALAEMRAGQKVSHWIWYIFPQIAGLGFSPMAQRYSITGLAEAIDYLRDPLLGPRYTEIVGMVTDQLERGVVVEHLMGGRTDALKLASSLTLFRAATRQLSAESSETFARTCDTLLETMAAKGYPPCTSTLEWV